MGTNKSPEWLQNTLGCLFIILICGCLYAVPLTRGWMTSVAKWATGTVFAEKPWKGIYYADAASSVAKTKDFKTVTECRTWAVEQADWDSKEPGEWAFSCGYKCEYTDDPLRRASPITQYDCEQIVTQ